MWRIQGFQGQIALKLELCVYTGFPKIEALLGSTDCILGSILGTPSPNFDVLVLRKAAPRTSTGDEPSGTLHGGLSKLWSLFGSPKLGPVL